MSLPRVRFTIRSVMVAVGLVAVVLTVEPFLFRQAVESVKYHNEYLWGNAVTVWIILNIALSLPIGITDAIIAARRDQAEARKRIS
jgi:hypothetical protein